jgi:hypothetical protein
VPQGWGELQSSLPSLWAVRCVGCIDRSNDQTIPIVQSGCLGTRHDNHSLMERETHEPLKVGTTTARVVALPSRACSLVGWLPCTTALRAR